MGILPDPTASDISEADVARVHALLDFALAPGVEVELSAGEVRLFSALTKWRDATPPPTAPAQVSRSAPRPRERRERHVARATSSADSGDDVPTAAPCPDPLNCRHRNRFPNGPWTCQRCHPTGVAA